MELLDNPVRPYAWGSSTAIPRLLGLPVTGDPVAELWLGAHPLAPSRVQGPDGPQRLDQVVAADPQRQLGPEVLARFGARLPFLLKMLGVARPLSLQVHPSAEAAGAGFAAEEAGGLPLDDPKRNYKDPGHKPELVVAVEPFHVLAGFRDVAGTLDLIDALAADVLRPYAAELVDRPDSDGLRTVVSELLQTRGGDRGRLVAGIVAGCERALADGAPYDLELTTIRDLAVAYPNDPGVAVALLMERRTLQPGDALFVPAGVLHAYLSGLAIEVMASSDNILRGGLTPKHVDVPELLRVLDVAAVPMLFTRAESAGLTTYAPPVEEFVLHVATLDGAELRVPGIGPRLLLCLEGDVAVLGRTRRLELARGQAAFVPASEAGLRLVGVGTVVSAGTGTMLVGNTVREA